MAALTNSSYSEQAVYRRSGYLPALLLNYL